MALPPLITDASVTLTWGAAGRYYGYCTIADVAYEFPDASSFTTLTNSTIAQEISAAAQELQDQLVRYYTMPYAGADDGILQTLRQINAKLAVANLLERYYQASEPSVTPLAEARRSWAELILTDIKDGVLQWSSPFGDAVPQAEKPLYPLSAGATIMPDPTSFDPLVANPVFSMGRTTFRRGQAF